MEHCWSDSIQMANIEKFNSGCSIVMEYFFPFAILLCISHSVVTLGKEGECLICKAKCQLSLLSDKVSSLKCLLISWWDCNGCGYKYCFNIYVDFIAEQLRGQSAVLRYQQYCNQILLRDKQGDRNSRQCLSASFYKSFHSKTLLVCQYWLF